MKEIEDRIREKFFNGSCLPEDGFQPINYDKYYKIMHIYFRYREHMRLHFPLILGLSSSRINELTRLNAKLNTFKKLCALFSQLGKMLQRSCRCGCTKMEIILVDIFFLRFYRQLVALSNELDIETKIGIFLEEKYGIKNCGSVKGKMSKFNRKGDRLTWKKFNLISD
uniref:Uncharacterized protein n=1 Tax=Parastrongyloides trichosuri TaxID=131310 RepID=A0A0N4ZJZ3_PARTI